MIGNFDNSNVVFGILPACLKNGSNPDAFRSGFFPTYNGPKGGGIKFQFAGDSPWEEGYGYVDGNLRPNGNNDQSRVLLSEGQYNLNVGVSGKNYTVAFWNNIPASFTPALAIPRIFYVFGNDVSTSIYNTNRVGCNITPSTTYTLTNLLTPETTTGRGYTFANATWNYSASDQKNLIVSVINNGTINWYIGNGVEITPYQFQIAYTASDQVFNKLYLFGISNTLGDFVGAYYPYDEFSTFILYDKALSVVEIQALNALGDDLGGLLGYDNGDGTLSLTVPTQSQVNFPRPPINYINRYIVNNSRRERR